MSMQTLNVLFRKVARLVGRSRRAEMDSLTGVRVAKKDDLAAFCLGNGIKVPFEYKLARY